MTFTSKAAIEFFRDELMLDSDQEMVDHCAKELFNEFYGKCLAAAALPALDDMNNKHATITSNGPLSTSAGSTISALSFPNNQYGLVVEYAAGNRDLFVWGEGKSAAGTTDPEIVDVYFISLLPEMPQELSDKVESMLKAGSNLQEFSGIVPTVARYAQRMGSEDRRPSLFEDVVAQIGELGMDKVCWPISDGRVRAIIGADERHADAVGYSRDYSRSFGIIERFMETFEPKAGEAPWRIRTHAALVRSGKAAEMFGSVAAYLFERSIASHIDDLDEIITIASELNLGAGTVLAYNDTDIRVSVDELDDKTVYRHDNIDRNEQNAFVTVINRAHGEPSSIDAYFADSWSHDFAAANGIGSDEPLDRKNYGWLVEKTREREGKLNEDDLVSRLETGRPTEGLAYSYDLVAKTLTVHPQAMRTGYLGYAPLMIENDLEILREVRAEQSSDWAEIQVRNPEEGAASAVDHIPLKKYMKRLTPAGTATPRLG